MLNYDAKEKHNPELSFLFKRYCKYAINRVRAFVKNITTTWYFLGGWELTQKVKMADPSKSKTVAEMIKESNLDGLDLMNYVQSLGVSFRPLPTDKNSSSMLAYFLDTCGDTQISIDTRPYRDLPLKRTKLFNCKSLKFKMNSKAKNYIETKWQNDLNNDSYLNWKTQAGLMDPRKGFCSVRYALGLAHENWWPDAKKNNMFLINTLGYELYTYVDLTFAKLRINDFTDV